MEERSVEQTQEINNCKLVKSMNFSITRGKAKVCIAKCSEECFVCDSSSYLLEIVCYN